MDNIITSWAFGFGGWIGVFASTVMFLNVPHNYTFLTLLLSPWLGGISLYVLMFATHAWISVSVQVAKAMTKYEIILAVLTSCIGVLVVAIARLIIEMDRGHRTLAQVAAEEPAPPARDTVSDSRSEDGEDGSESAGSDKESEDGEDGSESAGSDKESEDESGQGSGSEDKSGSSGESWTDESDNDESNDADDEEETTALNDAVIEDSSSSSYENINTPQLGAQPSRESPVPVISDI